MFALKARFYMYANASLKQKYVRQTMNIDPSGNNKAFLFFRFEGKN